MAVALIFRMVIRGTNNPKLRYFYRSIKMAYFKIVPRKTDPTVSATAPWYPRSTDTRTRVLTPWSSLVTPVYSHPCTHSRALTTAYGHQFVVTTPCTHNALQLRNSAAQVSQLAAKAFRLILRVRRLEVLARGARSELLDLHVVARLQLAAHRVQLVVVRVLDLAQRQTHLVLPERAVLAGRVAHSERRQLLQFL